MSEATQSVLECFGLREQPFAPTADPAYFHATPGHGECLFRLWTSIDERQGIAVVLGDYGSGKTTVLRKLLADMMDSGGAYQTALVDSPLPTWSSLDMLAHVSWRMGVTSQGSDYSDYMEALHKHLLDNREQINTLIIDDAQNLNKRGQLELLRLAQNLETAHHKLLNIVLFAQLEWAEALDAVPNFKQRINVLYRLRPFTLDETRALIEHRLEQAGGGAGEPVFTENAIRLIHAFGEGSPRWTITLCRNGLLTAAHLGVRQVDADIVLHTIDRTTSPDDEIRRRLEVFLAEQSAAEGSAASPFPHTPDGEDKGPSGTDGSYEDQANELLRRVARERGQRRPGGGGG